MFLTVHAKLDTEERKGGGTSHGSDSGSFNQDLEDFSWTKMSSFASVLRTISMGSNSGHL
jgi:hypothetical protein